MSYGKKIGTFLVNLICWYPCIIPWGISFAFIIFFGVGFPMFAWCVTGSGFGEWVYQDGRSSYFLKPNPNYGSFEEYSYTEKIKNDIYDNYGNKVGSYETNGATYSGSTEDTREYVAKYPAFILYMFYFPIQKTLAVLASFLALFTSRFYVSVTAPDDYTHIKYYRGLHSLFNVVVERSEKSQQKLMCKLEEKEQRKKEKQLKKEENKEMQEIKKKEQLKTADDVLGVVLKVIGIIGVAIALYFIFNSLF